MQVYRQSELRGLKLPRYLIDDYLLERSLAQLCGPSGGGKTFVYTDWACRLASDGRRVLLILGEGLFRYQTRLDAWQKHHQTTVPNDNLIIIGDVPSLPDIAQMGALIEITKKLGIFDLIVVDTFAKAMAGYDEKDSADVTVALANLTALRRASENATGLLITHFGWDNERQRGSSALYGECDTVVYLKKVARKKKEEEPEADSFGYLNVDEGPKSRRARLCLDKQRDGPDDIPDLVLERTDIELDYRSDEGHPVISCVYLPAKTSPSVTQKVGTNGHGKVVDLSSRVEVLITPSIKD